MYKNASHRRNYSGELDVFEAAGYFSGTGENPGYTNHAKNSQNLVGLEDHVQHVHQAAPRMSLDVPKSTNNPIINPPPHYHAADHRKQTKDNKKYKQPNSPGRRLASFLNSLFNQTSLKKKKPKHGGPNKDYEEEESPAGRRKRRISISHFRITGSANSDPKALYSGSGSGSGFRTPPPYADTPTKSYKQVITLAKTSGKLIKPTLQNEKICAEFKRSAGIDEETNFRFSNSGVSEKIVLEKNGCFGFSSEERDLMRKFRDGEDSDSSSDLFDLPNINLDFYSSGLPVYETTDVDRIKIGTPVSSTRSAM